jgi:hypothetical protein
MKRVLALGTLAAAFVACNPDIPQSIATSYVTALFDPANSNVPTPNLLATGSNGLLNVPKGPNTSAAQSDFVDFLNTLDGFPEDTPGKATFDSALAAGSVNTNSVLVVDLITGMRLTGAKPVYSATPGSSGPQSQISILPPATGWPSSHLIGVALIAIDLTQPHAADQPSLAGAQGANVVGSATWGLVRSKNSLLTCTTVYLPDGSINPDCRPTVSVIPSTEHDPALRIQDQTRTAAQLEQLRLLYLTFLDNLESQGIPRENVALAWNFKVTSRPQVPFDLANSVIPFPNDILRPPVTDGGTRHVALPPPNVPPLPDGGTPDIVKLYAGLNTLDGFSTTAPIVSVFNADTVGSLSNQSKIDAGSLLPAGTGFVRLGGAPAHPATAVAVKTCLDCASSPLPDGGIPDHPQRLQFVPSAPLDERSQYGVFITTNVTDTQGKKVIPSSAFVLLRSANRLYDGTHSTVDFISDADAQLLEQIRFGMMDFIEAVAASVGGRSNIALAWAFTTQSETSTLVTLRQLPQGLPAATANPLFMEDVTGTPLQPLCPAGCPHIANFVVGEIVTPFLLTGPGGVFNSNPAGASSRNIPFLLTLPTGAIPTNGYPVVIFGHGLTRARTDMLAIADALAQGGFAAIGIDAVWHGERTTCTDSHMVLPSGAPDDGACADPINQMCDATSGRCISRNRVSPTGCMFGTPSADKTCFDAKEGFCFGDNHCENGDYARAPATSIPSVPRISGWNLLTLGNLFATRDNFRQQVIDLSQLARVLENNATSAPTFNAQLMAATGTTKEIDGTSIHYVGQSLGGIMGTLYTSVATDVHRVVLNAAGGDYTDILLNAQSDQFKAIRAQFLATLAGEVPPLTPGTIGFDTFFGIADWILDPADPRNMAYSTMNLSTPLPDNRKVFVQYISDDQTIPNTATAKLITAGQRPPKQLDCFKFTPLESELAGPDRHGFLLNGLNMTVTGQAQTQVVTFLVTGTTPPPGTCP